MPYADFHCHLEHPDFDADRPQVVARAKKAGVAKAVAAGSNEEENKKILSACREYPDFLLAVVGTSPFDAVKLSDSQLREGLAFVKNHRSDIAGIGEVGLDHHHFSAPEEQSRQQEVFRAYLELAEELGLPVVVHSRKAEEQVFDALAEFKGLKVMLHCFLLPGLAERAAASNWLVSLPTIKSADRLKIAGRLPLGKLGCETDSPFLWKDEMTGKPKRNEPANVVEVYKEIALAAGKSIERVREAVWNNFIEFF